MSWASSFMATGPYTIARHGFRISLDGRQHGTNVDPPAHFDPGGITLDQIRLEQMALPLVPFHARPYVARPTVKWDKNGVNLPTKCHP